MQSTLRIQVGADCSVSALLIAPPGAHAMYLFAHGAGAGMTHPSMAMFADALAAAGVATLRFQFPYMERGSKRPDAPALCHATVRAAVAEAHSRAAGLPLFAGGRSFGGRMTSQAQQLDALPQLRGLIFLGFPLHPANQPSITRAEHLERVRIPMLFLQGDRDALAERSLIESVARDLGDRATLHLLEHADHSFHAPAKSGRKDADVRAEAVAATLAWIAQRGAPP